jgi:hypothetical protein
MKTIAYKAKSGKMQFKPVISINKLQSIISEGNKGFCLACGKIAEGVEPDARKYTCESCNAEKVYGFEELLIMGLI